MKTLNELFVDELAEMYETFPSDDKESKPIKKKAKSSKVKTTAGLLNEGDAKTAEL